jgi:hypothetical protein
MNVLANSMMGLKAANNGILAEMSTGAKNWVSMKSMKAEYQRRHEKWTGGFNLEAATRKNKGSQTDCDLEGLNLCKLEKIHWTPKATKRGTWRTLEETQESMKNGPINGQT